MISQICKLFFENRKTLIIFALLKKDFMKRIEINNTGIMAELSLFMFKEGDVFHAYCPELDLVGYDYTEEDAKKSFEYVLKDYLDYTIQNGTLEQDLINHGWKKSKG